MFQGKIQRAENGPDTAVSANGAEKEEEEEDLAYLVEDYWDTIDQLPLEVARDLELLKDLERQADEYLSSLKRDLASYIETAPDPAPLKLPPEDPIALAIATVSDEARPDTTEFLDSDLSAEALPVSDSTVELLPQREPPKTVEDTSHDEEALAASRQSVDGIEQGEYDVNVANGVNHKSSADAQLEELDVSTQDDDLDKRGHKREKSLEEMLFDPHAEPARSPKRTHHRDLLRQISKSMSSLVTVSEEKHGLALATYNTVDRHIRRMDDALAALEETIVMGVREGTGVGRLDGDGLRSKFGSDEDANDHGNDGKSRSGRKRFSKKKGQKKDPDESQDESNLAEPRYCYCNKVSSGNMVACDNEDCEREWFHYECVGINAPPKGRWFCKECTELLGSRRYKM